LRYAAKDIQQKYGTSITEAGIENRNIWTIAQSSTAQSIMIIKKLKNVE
jgi:hypothetical protein